jgi:hypothetical protein
MSALPPKADIGGTASLSPGCSGSPATSNKIIQKGLAFFAQTEQYCAQFGALAALQDPAPPASYARLSLEIGASRDNAGFAVGAMTGEASAG